MTETSLSVGEVLRRARLQHGLTLEQAAEGTRIRSLYLESLEKGDYDRLPGKVYVVGFVKSYSDYLGLETSEVVKLLKRQANVETPRPEKIFPVATEDKKVPGRKAILISTSILLLVLIGWKVSNRSRLSEEIPPVPQELSQQMLIPKKPVEKPAESASAAVKEEPKPHPVVIKAIQDVWMEIRDGSGKPVFSRVLKIGEEYWVPEEQKDLVMTAGNSGGLQMVVEGIAMKPLGRVGEVKRKIALNAPSLKVLLSPATQSN